MNDFWGNVAATVAAAALCGNCAVLWSLSARLARVETILEIRRNRK
jgi:hypothetical protein